ncbi:hypothetical protein LMTR3_09900 [Bradyrhizobium sp. LMTR 3]|nr:hypothetical protein LMTR3_09900 [Bradyrhizobium sp. LMTR 3]
MFKSQDHLPARLERLVLSGMADELKDPRLIENYVRNYNSERERLAGNAAAVRMRLEAKRDRIERRTSAQY